MTQRRLDGSRWKRTVLALAVRGLALLAAEPAPADERGWLGVWLGEATEGVQVVATVPGGPAALGGIRAGDVIVAADREAIGGEGDLGRVLDRLAPGSVLAVVVRRGGERRDAKVVLGVRPPAARVRIDTPEVAPFIGDRWELLGLQVAEISPELRKHYGGPEDAGVLVLRVPGEDQPLGKAGLRVGDLLVRIDGQPVLTEWQVREILARSLGRRAIEIGVTRAREAIALKIESAVLAEEAERARRRWIDAERREELDVMRRRLEAELALARDRVEELQKALARLEERE